MATAAEVRAYALGLRFEQARRLLRSDFEVAAIYAGLGRLEEAARLLPAPSECDDTTDRVVTIIRGAMLELERAAADTNRDYYLKIARDECLKRLAMVGAVLSAWAQALTDQLATCRHWLRLGDEVVRGERTVVKSDEPALWRWDHEDELHNARKNAAVGLNQIFPCSEAADVWLDELPDYFRDWARIEHGLAELTSTLPSTVPFVMATLQTEIVKALHCNALKLQPLGNRVSGGDTSRLSKPSALKELKELGYVRHKHGLGYFRPDAPPPNFTR